MPGSLHAAFWKPVAPEELALDRPRVDPEAGVEILFREAEVDDSSANETKVHTYVRLKVFDARGVEALDKIEIVEARDTPVINITARVIRPDGTIVEVDRNSIYAREIVRRGSQRLRAKAFSFAALEPGCIAEYQWDEISGDGIGGLQLYFADRFPAQRVRFRIKPFNYDNRGYQILTTGFRYEIPALHADSQGFYPFEMLDVPALREEPWMPPDDMVQPWLVLYFLRKGQSAESYWKETGRMLANDAARRSRPTEAIESLVRDQTAGAADDTEKLRRLSAYCRDHIRHLPDDRKAGTMSADSSATRARSAGEVLELGEGTPDEITLLFLGLARTAGFEARVACATDRSKRMFREPLPARFMLPDVVAAVRVAGAWQFFDPGRRAIPTGSLAWENEGVTALICDRGQSEFVQTPRTPRAESRVLRHARLAVEEDGTAEGEIEEEYHGHSAVAPRAEFADQTPARRAALVHGRIAARLPGAEVAEVNVDQVENPDAPLVISYRVRVPHYAARTEKRLVLPLAFFQRGAEPVFTESTREHVIYLPFEFREEDSVRFTLPAGFVLEDVAAPSSFALPPALEYQALLLRSVDGTSWSFQRSVNQGGMLFPAHTYHLLKPAFDELHRLDAEEAIAQQSE